MTNNLKTDYPCIVKLKLMHFFQQHLSIYAHTKIHQKRLNVTYILLINISIKAWLLIGISFILINLYMFWIN